MQVNTKNGGSRAATAFGIKFHVLFTVWVNSENTKPAYEILVLTCSHFFNVMYNYLVGLEANTLA